MRYINIEEAQPGMVLAKEIYDNCSRNLLAAGNKLNMEYIEKLRERGYQGFYIDDEFSAGIEVPESISPALRNRSVAAVEGGNIDTMLDVAKDIVDEILNRDSVSLDLVDLRTFDDYTYRHSVNVAVISTIIGMHMKITREELNELCSAAIFHDLGKMMVDPEILNKPGKLTREEFYEVKKHPQYSYDLLTERWNVSAKTKLGVLYHHENEDGSGYPKGLERDMIPYYAKVIHVADVYDALTSKRPYKKPYALSEALEYLMGGSSILFDQRIIQAFIKAVPVYPKGVEVNLSNGEKAVVVENTFAPLRPVVRLTSTGEDIDLSDDCNYRKVTIHPATVVENDFSRSVGVENIVKIKRKEILIVDDMVTNLRQVRSILEKDYKIIMVKSGNQALDFLKSNKIPDLIIMDIDLPDIDGVETVKIIQKRISPYIPIVFLTAHSDKETVMRCKQVKAVDYIVKPFQPVYIQERIRIALGGRE